MQVGEEAKKLFAEAQTMLQEFIDQKHVTLNGIVGIYPANAVGDDIEVYEDESRDTPVQTFYGLRQQAEKDDKADPYATLACFISSSLLFSRDPAAARGCSCTCHLWWATCMRSCTCACVSCMSIGPAL